MTADFSGYATRANVKCSDGRTIMPNAFQHNDGSKVPLVWQHGHNDVNNLLGHAVLEHRNDGVYAYGYFNDTPSGHSAKRAVIHRDVDSLSIFANGLVQDGANVTHGQIREVSLVLAGANPHAKIDNVIIHSDGYPEELDDAVVIRSGELLHNEPQNKEEKMATDNENKNDDERTVQDVLDSLTEEQKIAVQYFYSEMADIAGEDEEDEEDNATHYDTNEDTMTHNVFENGKTLSHDNIVQIRSEMDDVIAEFAKRGEGTLKDALSHAATESEYIAHAIAKDTDYGINKLDLLFPDAKPVNGELPEVIRRNQEWVNAVLSGVSKRPFSRLRMMNYNMTHEEARARGYVTGNMKREQYFSMSKRTTQPTTIYQKQKIDRDDVVDITNVDIVAWMWKEMRISLNEEVARAIVFGDGRDIDDPDKIREDCIRPIINEEELYAHRVVIKDETASDPVKLMDKIFTLRNKYKGSGKPTLFVSEDFVTNMLVARKTNSAGDPGDRYFDTVEMLARALNVDKIVEFDSYFSANAKIKATDSEDDSGTPVNVPAGSKLVAVMVNLSDYAVGTDRGGEITTFDDFDIDFNQYKYLMEGRMSGALIKPKSAVILLSGGTEYESDPLYGSAPTTEPTKPKSTKPLPDEETLL